MQNIAIIGGGPAGISLAYELRKKYPLCDIHIFESRDKTGGQAECKTYHNFSHPLGTCFSHLGYDIVNNTAVEMGLRLKYTKGRPYVRAKDHEILEVEKSITGISELLLTVLKLLSFRILWKLFRQDKNPTWRINQTPFSFFLKLYRVKLKNSMISVGTTGQLYGPPDQITTHNAFLWYTPALFKSMLLRKAYVLHEGFDELFRLTLLQTNAIVHYNHKVTEVTNTGNAVSISSYPGEFDHCFVTVPLDRIKTPLSPMLDSSVFNDQHIISMHVRFDGDERHFNAYTFEVCDHINSIMAMPLGEDDIRTGVSWMLVKISDKQASSSQRELLELIKKDLKKIPIEANLEVLDFRVYRYNIHYSPQQLALQIPSKIQELQGKENISYSGGTLSHWNIESIWQYNKILVRNL